MKTVLPDGGYCTETLVGFPAIGGRSGANLSTYHSQLPGPAYLFEAVDPARLSRARACGCSRQWSRILPIRFALRYNIFAEDYGDI